MVITSFGSDRQNLPYLNLRHVVFLLLKCVVSSCQSLKRLLQNSESGKGFKRIFKLFAINHWIAKDKFIPKTDSLQKNQKVSKNFLICWVCRYLSQLLVSAIRNRKHKSDLHGRRTRRTRNVRGRLQFDSEQLSKDQGFWSSVLQTNALKMEFSGCSNSKDIWHRSKTASQEKNLIPPAKHVMIRGSFTALRCRQLAVTDSTKTSV